jgi:DNA-binding XRE family transcriptional regulator
MQNQQNQQQQLEEAFFMKSYKWNDIKHRKMTPERIAAADRRVEEEIVAIRLRELREAEGVTQEEVAKRVAVAQAQVSRAENRGNPHIDTVRRYLEALGYTLEVSAVKKDKRVTIAL